VVPSRYYGSEVAASAARTEPQARRNQKVELDLQPRRYGAGYS
jgi:hypothetical protein